MRRRALFVVSALVLSGCGVAVDVDSPHSSTSITQTSITIAQSSTSTTRSAEESTVPDTSSTPEAAAVRDLARHLSVPEGEVEVVSVESVIWPDGSLGCPQPGMYYTQALVEGSQVLLTHDGRGYDYHASEGGTPFLCASADKDGGYVFVPPPGFND